MDGVEETDQLNSAPTTFIEVAGTSLKSALDVARKFGVVRDNVRAVWAGWYYKTYGYWTSVNSALATWAVVAGLAGD